MNKGKMTPYPLYNSVNPLLSDCKDSLNIFIGKRFWIWDKQEHNEQFIKIVCQCCFNHIIGRAVKNNKEYDIFDFQKVIYVAIERNQNIWILKNKGIGITTLFSMENTVKFRIR